MVKLDLNKYGLSYLKSKPPATWTDSELDKLIDAFANGGIAPYAPIPFTPTAVESLLNASYCRRCGKCCLGYPTDPGLTVTEGELQKIARHSKYTYKYIKRHSQKYKHPQRDDARLLPQPCMFYQQGECVVYKWRPLICKTYPISTSLHGGKIYTKISVRCDYGKDLYRSLLKSHIEKGGTLLFDI